MNLDQLSVVVRERSLPELYDLAVLLSRRHALHLTVLTMIAAAPWVVLNWLLLTGMPEDTWLPLAWLVVLMVIQAPIASAPITAYLGEALFNHQPTVREALVTAWRGWAPLLVIGLGRGAVVALGVLLTSEIGDGLPGLLLLMLLLFHPAHAVEVVLLERQPLRASLRRANLLMSSWRSEALIQLLVAALVVVAGSLVVALAGAQVIRLLFWSWLESGGEAWQFWFHPGMSPLAILLPWPFVAYLATVRFLAYIDLRTRREGWELELELRRAGRRLEPVGEESHSQIRPSVGPVLPLVVLLLGLTPSLSAAEGSHLIVQDQLDGAPWYDSETGAWKRVDLPEEEIGNQYEDGTEGIPGFAYLMYALVALATALIIVQFVRQRRGNRSPGRIGDSTNASARWSALPFALAGSTGDPEAAFRAACAAGEWTRAVIWLYAWQLLRLEGAGVVRLLPGKTNRVYVREAAAVPAAGEALAETVAIFERAHFGHQPAKRSEILGLVARHRDLLAALPRPSGAAS